ncbi:MAG: aminotransferase class I/II-fold pyridoxal phosphate-dependent enzyme [Planctomycetota bacterium]|nr:aminotransferase class I/II-fold pyridoxal phosphate-dependent enzyme [Planctomycetota bacterium]
MPHTQTASRLRPFGTSIFAEMSVLATQHNAINLSQGFPDFDGPEFLKAAAQQAIEIGHNQYARTQGVPALNEAIAAWWKRGGGCEVDPHAEITVTSGCTEALAACCLGLLEPGDEVVCFEPFYDAYLADVALAGAVPRAVTLRPNRDRSAFGFDETELRRAFTPRTRAVLLNTPHNPTGKVFTRDELALIADLAIEHGTIVLADEVYERLVFEPARPHISIASLPGMAERTITLSSLGKTFSMTGWKIGWAIAPPAFTAGVRAAHQFLTFASATPLQHAAAVALASEEGEAYVEQLQRDYAKRRRFLADALTELGFGVIEPEGTYFIMADHTAVSERLGLTNGKGEPADDFVMSRWLIEHAGVATIPPSVFYHDKMEGRKYLRFAFCKRAETLRAAVDRMRTAIGSARRVQA